MCACEAAPFRDQTCCPGVVVEPHRFKAFNLSSLPFPVDVPPVRSMPRRRGVLVSVVVRLVTACRVASSRIHGSPAPTWQVHICAHLPHGLEQSDAVNVGTGSLCVAAALYPGP